jgi:hypothetical protein
MKDLRYFREEGKFLDHAWGVYRDYFLSRNNFLSQYSRISSPERKDLFLMIVSDYRLLVRDGAYHLVENQQHLYLDYLDQTYKFISIMSLIEAMFSGEEYVDFFQWLMMKKRRKHIFPIADEKILEQYYREYKIEFGAKKAVKFFSELDEDAQRYLATRIMIDNDHKPAEVVAQKLYIIRSEFVHQARLILEFNDGLMFSKREGNVMYSMLSLKDLQLLFEHGMLHHFGITPDVRKI